MPLFPAGKGPRPGVDLPAWEVALLLQVNRPRYLDVTTRMNPFNPAPVVVEFSEWFWRHTGWYVPPLSWICVAAALFLTGILCCSIGFRYWKDPGDIFP